MSEYVQVLPLTGTTTRGGVRIDISPFHSVPFGVLPDPEPTDFQSNPTTGPQQPITITFDKPVEVIEIRAKNSSKAGNLIIAYDIDGKELIRSEFNYGVITKIFNSVQTYGYPVSIRRIEAKDIRRIELIPADGDYVFYGNFVILPQDTAVTTPPPSSDPLDRIEIPLRIRAIALPDNAAISIPIRINALPAIPQFDPAEQIVPSEIQVNPIPIPMEWAFDKSWRTLTSGKISGYFDDSRELKTLLNFGNDYQSLLTNWIRDPQDNESLLVKLYNPLPIEISEKTLGWISREISPPLIDRISVYVTPDSRVVFFLRPPNSAMETLGLYGTSIDSMNLSKLIPTGSVQISVQDVLYDNKILTEHYLTAFEGVELNVDYTDYNNFVHFGSAGARLTAFRQKLANIEDINAQIGLQHTAASASIAGGAVSHISGTAQFASITALIDERNSIIRGLDGYERFLYYNTGSFSGSISGLKDDPIVYIAEVSWPKSGGIPLSITASQAETFYASQLEVAQDYDRWNQEYLINNIPTYLIDDTDSTDYIQFLNLVGHHFDLVKLYVDNMTDIYDRDPSPDRGLARDLVWHVGQSLGIQMPNQYAIKALIDYYTTDSSTTTQPNYAQAMYETWKRFIHNQIFVSKAKGTRAGLEALVNVYGLKPEIIRVRESVIPSAVSATGSFEAFEELTNTIVLDGNQALTIPFASTGLFSPFTIELRFGIRPTSASFTSSVLMHGTSPNDWAIVVVPTGSLANQKGVLRLLDPAGATEMETSIGDFYSGDFFTIMLRGDSGPTDFYVKKYIDESFEYSYMNSASLSFAPTQSANIVLGSDGTLGTGSIGVKLDEFRLWKEEISNTTFDDHVKFPGLYAGSMTSSAYDNLVFRHSFTKAQNLNATSSLQNETPNPNATGSLSASIASGFAASASYPYNMEIATRQTQRFVPNAGFQYASNTVQIASAPTFDRDAMMMTGSTAIPTLSRFRKVSRIKDESQAQPLVGFYLSLAESINDSILRSVGNVDINQLIGDPSNLYGTGYPDLINLNKYYKRNFAPTFDQNKFIRFTEGLLEGAFKQAEGLKAASGKIITGITIEPTILERSKPRAFRPLKTDGAGTQAERQAYQLLRNSGSLPGTRNADARIEQSGSYRPSALLNILEDNIEDIVEDIVFASVSNLQANVQQVTQSVYADTRPLSVILDTDDLFDVLATYNAHFAQIDLTDEQDVFAYINQLEGRITSEESIGNIIYAFMTPLNAEIDANIVTTRIVGFASQSYLMPNILPASDLSDPRSTTYFTRNDGLIGISRIRQVLYKSSSLTDRGNWVEGETYSRNDLVTQVGISGSGSPGNGAQFVCLTDRVTAPNGTIVNFTSNLAPYLDTTNWKAASYVSEQYLDIKKAIISGSSPFGTGDVAIVETSNPGAVFLGYSKTHYKYYRDTTTGFVRSRYTGCKQTGATTFDGESPVEILRSSEAQLFVKDGTPIQSDSDEGGPILDVR